MLGSVLLSTGALAGSRNPADYPLRVHIFQFNSRSHYYHPGLGVSDSLNDVDGEGRANLYENGSPRGFDFSFQCGVHLMGSAGFETYMARWKKPGRVIEIIMPVMGGKPGEMNSCDLNVTMKADSVYVRHNGLLGEEPASQFKDWMVKHQYDPEHGKDEPVNSPAAPAQTGDATKAAPAGTGANAR